MNWLNYLFGSGTADNTNTTAFSNNPLPNPDWSDAFYNYGEATKKSAEALTVIAIVVGGIYALEKFK